MSVISFLKKGRLRKALAAAVLALSIHTSTLAYGQQKHTRSFSTQTSTSGTAFYDFYESLRNQELWSQEQEIRLAQLATAYGKKLRDEILADIDARLYDLAKQKFDELEIIYDLLAYLKRDRDFHQVVASALAAFERLTIKLKILDESVPLGSYVGEAGNFQWIVKAEETDKGVRVSYASRGYPKNDEEFRKATAKMPPKVTEFVRQRVMLTKNSRSRMHR